MDGFLRVDTSSNLPISPTNSFMADEVASICPLITPSPPTNDLINALPEPTEPSFVIGEVLANKLQQVQDDDKTAGDSASSSSSAIAEQLLNHRNVYHHILKADDTEMQETNGKSQNLQLTFRNPPDNYFFMSWNWVLIRKLSLWTFLAGLVAMVALVIAMITSLPKTCNPQTAWFQGSLFYEVFPPSFYSKNGMEGDFKGLSLKADYIMSLKVQAIRLNSIFPSPHYPRDFTNTTSLTKIAPSLGNLSDFNEMVKHFHSRNISVVLDLPLKPLTYSLFSRPVNGSKLEEFEQKDLVEEAILFWIRQGVNGFYLKDLEHFIGDVNLGSSLRKWKGLLGPDRPLIVSESFFNAMAVNSLNLVLNNVDLVDVRLKIELGVQEINRQLSKLQNSTLFTKPGSPWVLWSLGNLESETRLANILPYSNGTLGATMLQLMLPGTPSIFYGDEIGLQQVLDPQNERQDIKHLHHLTMMDFAGYDQKVLSWNHGEKTQSHFNQLNVITKLTTLRLTSPAIYMNSVWKDGENSGNAEIKYAKDDFLVIQRWFPRRKSYVIASNLGSGRISADLSRLLYSGQVVVGPKFDSEPETISFKEVALWPGESVVIQLD